MIGFTENSRGRYKCNYCDHKTYKTWGGANNHVEQNHALQVERDKAIQRAEYAERAKAELSRQLADANKRSEKKPATEYWDVPGIYCSTCKQAWRGGRIPRGQTVENTPHSVCGMTTLMLVLEIN